MRRVLTACVVLLMASCLAAGAHASAILQSTQSGSGLLRIQGYDDESLNQAMIRISTTGRFHMQVVGLYPLDLRGTWNNTGQGVYNLSIDSGFGDDGASSGGRAVVDGYTLTQFELSGVTAGNPFYVSFGAAGYGVPQPGPDGFSLGLTLGLYLTGHHHHTHYFYTQPSISLYIHAGTPHRGHRPAPIPGAGGNHSGRGNHTGGGTGSGAGNRTSGGTRTSGGSSSGGGSSNDRSAFGSGTRTNNGTIAGGGSTSGGGNRNSGGAHSGGAAKSSQSSPRGAPAKTDKSR